MNTTIASLLNEDYLSVKDNQLKFDYSLFLNNLLQFLLVVIMGYIGKKF